MANPRHVEIVKHGQARFSNWRRENPNVRVDLSGADLSGVVLCLTDMSNAKLRNSILSAAVLREANLKTADLAESDLSGADLSFSYLNGADLSDAVVNNANLAGAYLCDTMLCRANLREANLNGTHLSNAKLRNTNLAAANLSGAMLSGADLRNASLCDADLRGADLSRANLELVDLRRTNLDSATRIDGKWRRVWQIVNGEAVRGGYCELDLSHADLRHVDFSGLDLSGSSFVGADVSNANFSDAILRGADLRDARFHDTKLNNVDLRNATGLVDIKHEGPSSLGFDTLQRTGELPDEFLTGCGLPGDWIAQLRPIINATRPIQFYSCFISYSSNDEEFCERLHSQMRDDGLRVWFAPEDAKGGRLLHEQIDRAIRVYDKLLLVLSVASLNSRWVKHEVHRAIQREKQECRRILFPIRLVDYDVIKLHDWDDSRLNIDVAEEVCRYYIPDFSNWKEEDAFQSAYSKLIIDLRAEADSESTES